MNAEEVVKKGFYKAIDELSITEENYKNNKEQPALLFMSKVGDDINKFSASTNMDDIMFIMALVVDVSQNSNLPIDDVLLLVKQMFEDQD